jgi:HK97 family phage portal protein
VARVGWFTRAIRPPEPVEPNDNTPAEAAPGTVGPPDYRPGDPSGVVVAPDPPASPPPAFPRAMPWSGWPAEWYTPSWNGARAAMGDTAWACIDKNASVMAAMPAYLVGAPESLDAAWLANPDPDLYASWEEAAKQVFWDYHLGEAFLIATARYASGYPARWHVLPAWSVSVEIDGDGLRRYRVGSVDVTGRLLHIRYQGSVGDAHGHGPLEAARLSLVAEDVLARYLTGFAAGGGVPSSVLMVDAELTADQASTLQAQWVSARASHLGEPAVLSGGVTWQATQATPLAAGTQEQLDRARARIAVLFGVPPFLMGLPSGGDPMTYQNVGALFEHHWRAGLMPKAAAVMSALSGWLLPRGVAVELNRDSYVQAEPYQRAQTYEILHRIGAISVDEIRELERLTLTGAAGLSLPAPAPAPEPVVINE